MESVTFFALAAGLICLLGAVVARRSGFATVAASVICFAFLSAYLALEWWRSDDAPAAGFGSFIAATTSLLLLAGGLLGVAVDRWRRVGEGANLTRVSR